MLERSHFSRQLLSDDEDFDAMDSQSLGKRADSDQSLSLLELEHSTSMEIPSSTDLSMMVSPTTFNRTLDNLMGTTSSRLQNASTTDPNVMLHSPPKGGRARREETPAQRLARLGEQISRMMPKSESREEKMDHSSFLAQFVDGKMEPIVSPAESGRSKGSRRGRRAGLQQ